MLLPLKDVSRDSNFVLACCVLHNFCYLNDDFVIQDMVQNVQMLRGRDVGVYNDEASKRHGEAKRERIKGIL